LKYLNLATSLLAVVLLNGCLEVEDDNSDVQALLDQAENTVSIKGVVVDALDFNPVGNALITVKVGSTDLISNFEVTNGDFELTGLPESSDIEIVISSQDNLFLSRTFFTQTHYGSKGGVDDVGNFVVSESVDVEISVIDNKTSSAFTTLEFIAYSHSGTNSSAYKYKHVSSFNTETGMYTITLPKFIDTSISANLDFDKDGRVDFTPELTNFLRGRDLYIGSANKKEFSTIYIKEVAIATDLEIRLSLVDEAAQSLTGATFYIEDSVVDSTYDESTNQYVITTQLKDSVSLQVPAFTSNEVKYQSSAFTVRQLEDGNLYIQKNGSYNSCCITIPNSDRINFALSPQVILESETPVKVILSSKVVAPENASYSVFYSQPVKVLAENVSLTNRFGYTVTKGNDSANDLILPGTTLIKNGYNVPVTMVSSLNNTRLTLIPTMLLTPGNSYQYDVNSVMSIASEESDDLDGDSLSFQLAPSIDEVFSVTEIKLDNENFTTNGSLITLANTAGEVSFPNNLYSYVHLYLPTSINSLQNLTLRQVSVVRAGIASVVIENYNIVVDGDIMVESVGILTVANNEFIVKKDNYRSVIINSAQAETQNVYRKRLYLNAADNTDAETNTISFEYSYETKTGEVSTGIMTIPVQ
jgi:hypothetical protein